MHFVVALTSARNPLTSQHDHKRNLTRTTHGHVVHQGHVLAISRTAHLQRTCRCACTPYVPCTCRYEPICRALESREPFGRTYSPSATRVDKRVPKAASVSASCSAENSHYTTDKTSCQIRSRDHLLACCAFCLVAAQYHS